LYLHLIDPFDPLDLREGRGARPHIRPHIRHAWLKAAAPVKLFPQPWTAPLKARQRSSV
jgi:hypothetical protein